MTNSNLLSIKTVDFNGDTLQAAQDHNGKIYTGISYICNGIGLSKSQKDTQIQNIQSDEVLSRGCLKFQAGVFDPNNETIAIEIDFLPLWLAKIPITPKMKIENDNLKEQYGHDFPTTVDKLIEYQIKAKDVLAKAFLDGNFIKNYLCLDPEDRAIAYFQEIKQRKLLEQQTQELIPKARSFEQLISAGNSQTMLEVGKAFKTGRNRLFAFLRSKNILMEGKDKQNVPFQQYLEQKLFVVREYTIPDEDGELINRTQTLVTAKGIKFIDKLLKEIDYDLEAFSDLD